MNLFQWLAVPTLGALFLLEFAGLILGRTRYRVGALRCLVWLVGAVTIARPDFVQALATAVGIASGANLVSYVVALAFFATSFYFYSRSTRMQQQLTKLIRHLAIQEARQGGEATAESRLP